MQQAPLSTGDPVTLTDHLGFEMATLFLFFKPSSLIDQSIADELTKACAGRPILVQQITLKTGDEPVAKQHKITQTPSGILFDRRGREVGRGQSVAELIPLAMQATDVGRIDWAMPNTPQADEIKKLVGAPDPRRLPGIMRAMSLRPEAMAGMIQMANKMHFTDGALKSQTKELIATYVSSLNQCPFCLTSHAGFLAQKGQDTRDVDAVALGDPSKALGLSPKERKLLDYVKLLTQEPWKVRDTTIEGLRSAGWTDPEIYEATFDIALFAFYNRMANAYGLDMAPNGWRPPKK